MSSQAVAWAIVHKAGGMSAKAVLLSLANYANEYGECWASQATIAEGAECSVRQVRRILGDLAERGLIERERRGGAGMGRDTDMIRLRMRELPAILTSKRRAEEQPAITAASSKQQPDKLAASQATGQPDRGAKGQFVRGATGQMEGGNRTIMSDNPKNPFKNPLNPPGFEEAWKLWPKHHRASSRKVSLSRWKSLSPDPQQMLRAIALYLDSPDAKKTTPDGVRGGFVKAFEAWLNTQAEFWLEQAGAAPADPQADRLRVYRETGIWNPLWGDEPAPDLIALAGGKP